MKKSLGGYETTFIFRTDITDEVRKTYIEKIKSLIETYAGKVLAVEDWGKRRLAYSIRKESRGYYTYLLYSGSNTLVAELERNLRLNEQVLRFLTIKLSDDFDENKFKYMPTVNASQPTDEYREVASHG